ASRLGRYPQPARRTAGQAGGQLAGQAGRQGLAEQLPGARVQPSEVGVQVAAATADDAERGEHAQGGPRPGRRGDWCLAQRGAERADQRGRLDQALAVLRGGVRVRGDTAAAAEPYPPVMKLEGTDGDIQLEPGN